MTRIGKPVIVKVYPNRRLFDTSAGRYVTVDHLGQWASRRVRFMVLDAKTGDDLTDEFVTSAPRASKPRRRTVH